MVKIKFPLEWYEGQGIESEWMWAFTEDEGYRIDNIPVFVAEAFYGDLVSAEVDEDGVLTYKEVVQEGPFYRCYVFFDRNHPEESSICKLMWELGDRYGAKVEAASRSLLAVAYDDDKGHAIFEHLVELHKSGIIQDFYIDHAEDQ